MRITFLCSGLTPGRDGVGDYTMRLAGEIVRQGHNASIIALHDRHAPEATCISPCMDGEISFPTLRLSSKMPWGDRVALAKDHVLAFDAQRVSLQFVPYGFHDKGIVGNLGRRLTAIAGKRQMHIMFHELWIGAHCNARWKDRLVGAVQRDCILRLLRQIAPAAVATSNGTYVGLLRRLGLAVNLLPLFGNIPIIEDTGLEWLNDSFERAGFAPECDGSQSAWVFAFFGALHPVWPPEPLFSYITSAAKTSRKTVIVAGIGRLGPGEALWRRLSGDYGAFRFIHFGEQAVDRISRFLQTADFGLATSPWALIGKSGTVASMLEHGLPVIVNRDDVHFPGLGEVETTSPLLIKMDKTLPARLPSLMRQPARSTLPEVARLFLQQIAPPPG